MLHPPPHIDLEPYPENPIPTIHTCTPVVGCLMHALDHDTHSHMREETARSRSLQHFQLLFFLQVRSREDVPLSIVLDNGNDTQLRRQNAVCIELMCTPLKALNIVDDALVC